MADYYAHKVRDFFEAGHNCSQSVFMPLAEGRMDAGLASRLSSPFGGGIGGLEKTCGALCGGLMAIGLFIGQEGIDKDTQERERETAVRLYDAFVEEFATDECQVLKEMAFDNPPADGGRPCCKYVAFCADWIADEFNLKV